MPTDRQEDTYAFRIRYPDERPIRLHILSMYHFLAFFTVCIWGTTFVSTKVLLSHGFSPSGIFLVRFLLAYAGMWIMCRKSLLFPSWRDELLAVVAGATGGSFYFLTENTALTYSPAGHVSFIVCLAPLFTAALCLFRPQASKRLKPRLWAGMFVALSGVALITIERTGTSSWHGNLLALSAAMLWAVYQHVIGPLSERYSPATVTRKVFGYGVLTLTLYELGRSAVGYGNEFTALTTILAEKGQEPVVWGNLLFLGLIASLACYFTWNKVIDALGAVTSSNYIYINPLTTCVFSAIILGEHFTTAAATGGLAILIGVWLAVRPTAGKT